MAKKPRKHPAKDARKTEKIEAAEREALRRAFKGCYSELYQSSPKKTKE
jgi:hypothetical protein